MYKSYKPLFTALLTGDISNERHIMKLSNFSLLDLHMITSSTPYRLHLLPIYMHKAGLML